MSLTGSQGQPGQPHFENPRCPSTAQHGPAPSTWPTTTSRTIPSARRAPSFKFSLTHHLKAATSFPAKVWACWRGRQGSRMTPRPEKGPHMTMQLAKRGRQEGMAARAAPGALHHVSAPGSRRFHLIQHTLAEDDGQCRRTTGLYRGLYRWGWAAGDAAGGSGAGKGRADPGSSACSSSGSSQRSRIEDTFTTILPAPIATFSSCPRHFESHFGLTRGTC